MRIDSCIEFVNSYQQSKRCLRIEKVIFKWNYVDFCEIYTWEDFIWKKSFRQDFVFENLKILLQYDLPHSHTSNINDYEQKMKVNLKA